MKTEKYKLLQWYPSLPDDWEEGDIIQKENGQLLFSNNTSYVHSYSNITEKELKNPDFWEKIQSKNYQILSLQNDATGKIIKEQEEIDAWERAKENMGRWNIYSIKRLSDGKVLTKGDRVSAINNFYVKPPYLKFSQNASGLWAIGYYNTTIAEFKFVENELCVIYNFRKKFGQSIEHVQKLKNVLFTTEDGCEITDYDEFRFMWGVALQASGGDLLKQGWIKGLLDNDTPPSNRKWFWEKVNAEKYIELNRKEYSKQDIIDAVNEIGVDAVENWNGKNENVILITEKNLFSKLKIKNYEN